MAKAPPLNYRPAPPAPPVAPAPPRVIAASPALAAPYGRTPLPISTPYGQRQLAPRAPFISPALAAPYGKAPPLPPATDIYKAMAAEVYSNPDAETQDKLAEEQDELAADEDISELLGFDVALDVPPARPEDEPPPSYLCMRGPWAGARYTPPRGNYADVPVVGGMQRGVYRFSPEAIGGAAYSWVPDAKGA